MASTEPSGWPPPQQLPPPPGTGGGRGGTGTAVVATVVDVAVFIAVVVHVVAVAELATPKGAVGPALALHGVAVQLVQQLDKRVQVESCVCPRAARQDGLGADVQRALARRRAFKRKGRVAAAAVNTSLRSAGA
jgi:hypothetical protein